MNWAGQSRGAEPGSPSMVGGVGAWVYLPELRNVLSARLNNMKGTVVYFTYEIEP